MDIVTDGGAVWGGVVVSVDRERFSCKGSAHQTWQQMGLWIVALRNLFRRPRNIEVAQRGCSEAMRRGVGAEHLLEGGLRGPVRVDRRKGNLFMEHARGRCAIDRGTRREDEVLHANGNRRVKQGDTADEVRLEVPLWLRHALSDDAQRPDVEDGVNPRIAQQALHAIPVCVAAND